MFVLFTLVEGRTEDIAQDLSDKCRDCAAALAAFRGVSKAYKLSDSSPGSEDALPAFFAVVNIGTRDGAGISAIHPAMQVPIVMHLPPTAFHAFCSAEKAQDPSCSPEASQFARARVPKESLSAAHYRIATAEFFGGALGDGWNEDDDKKLGELIQQHKRDKVHGKIHFFSPAENQLFLLQRFKNEAPPEQRLLEWANARTKRQVNYAFEDHQDKGQTKRTVLLILLPPMLLLACIQAARVSPTLKIMEAPPRNAKRP
ncbi:hypothetical protein, conserved [Eimeria brunetti]|uniref:Uncharacterized protein n=1 Tax=Eimeria brunetti TaxID=51314 RepID=U6LG26_9EIME|nr:hypothetical protein, conserved [Eimeria brunetti]